MQTHQEVLQRECRRSLHADATGAQPDVATALPPAASTLATLPHSTPLRMYYERTISPPTEVKKGYFGGERELVGGRGEEEASESCSITLEDQEEEAQEEGGASSSLPRSDWATSSTILPHSTPLRMYYTRTLQPPTEAKRKCNAGDAAGGGEQEEEEEGAMNVIMHGVFGCLDQGHSALRKDEFQYDAAAAAAGVGIGLTSCEGGVGEVPPPLDQPADVLQEIGLV